MEMNGLNGEDPRGEKLITQEEMIAGISWFGRERKREESNKSEIVKKGRENDPLSFHFFFASKCFCIHESPESPIPLFKMIIMMLMMR